MIILFVALFIIGIIFGKRNNKDEIMLCIFFQIAIFCIMYTVSCIVPVSKESLRYVRSDIYYLQEDLDLHSTSLYQYKSVEVLTGNSERKTVEIDITKIAELKTCNIYEPVIEVYSPVSFKREYWYQYIYTFPHYYGGYYMVMYEPSDEAYTQFKKLF